MGDNVDLLIHHFAYFPISSYNKSEAGYQYKQKFDLKEKYQGKIFLETQDGGVNTTPCLRPSMNKLK